MRRSFLGPSIVYRRFVKSFAIISTLFSYMLKKDSGTDWDQSIVSAEDQKEAFDRLKSRVI